MLPTAAFIVNKCHENISPAFKINLVNKNTFFC